MFPMFLPCQEREEARAILKAFAELLEDSAAKIEYKEDIEKNEIIL